MYLVALVIVLSQDTDQMFLNPDENRLEKNKLTVVACSYVGRIVFNDAFVSL